MLFSAVIPICNTAAYLRECVDSVLRQSVSDFEVILVDDGSTDGCGAICDEYAARDGRVRVIHRENGGQASARNAGVAASSGDYVVFLDSDDFILGDDFFSSLAEGFASGADVVLFRYYKYFSPEKMTVTPSLSGLSGLSKPKLLEELVRRDAFFCSCWSKSVRRSLLLEGGIAFDESLRCEDMDWYYNVVTKAEKLAAIDRAFICYRQRGGSVTSGAGEKTVADYLTTLRRWRPRFEAVPDGVQREAMLSSLAKLYCNLLIMYSRDRSGLRRFKEEIAAERGLLVHRLNPRTRKIYASVKALGVEKTCGLISLVDRHKNKR